MKFTLKLFLVISLFSSVTFAEGDMPGGGYFDGDMPGGGYTCTENCTEDGQSQPPLTNSTNSDGSQNDDSILTFIEDYLYSLFG